MARPQRNNVDYFPFYCDEGNKMFYLEETYGNDGFAAFLKILRELAKADYHYLDLSKNTTKMFLSAKCKISKDVLEAIINDLVDLEKFDSDLWNNESIIYCQDFINSIQDAYAKRSNNCIDRKSLIELLISKGRLKPSKGESKPSKLPIDSSVNPQSKEEDSKGEEKKQQFSKELLEFANKFYDALVKYEVMKKRQKTINKENLNDLRLLNEKDGFSWEEINDIAAYYFQVGCARAGGLFVIKSLSGLREKANNLNAAIVRLNNQD